MTKKVYEQKYFLCHNCKFKLRILTKNLVTFKRWDGDLGSKNPLL